MSRHCILGWAGFLLLLCLARPAIGQTAPAAQTAPESTAAAPVKADTIAPIQVTLHDGRVLTAARVESRFQDYVHVIHLDGREEYILANKIASIRRADGQDWTSN